MKNPSEVFLKNGDGLVIVCAVSKKIGLGHFGRMRALYDWCISKSFNAQIYVLVLDGGFVSLPAISVMGMNIISFDDDYEWLNKKIKSTSFFNSGVGIVFDMPFLKKNHLANFPDSKIFIVRDDFVENDEFVGQTLVYPNYYFKLPDIPGFLGVETIPKEYMWESARYKIDSIPGVCISFGGSMVGTNLANMLIFHLMDQGFHSCVSIFADVPKSFTAVDLSVFKLSFFFPLYAVPTEHLILSVGRSMWEALRVRSKPFFVVSLTKEQDLYMTELSSTEVVKKLTIDDINRFEVISSLLRVILQSIGTCSVYYIDPFIVRPVLLSCSAELVNDKY